MQIATTHYTDSMYKVYLDVILQDLRFYLLITPLSQFLRE